MTWVKLDDNALDDPDFLRLPRGVRLFHLEALAWSNRHGAGGVIPASAAVRFTDEAIRALIAAGLWEEADDSDGYRIVWLLDDQPTPEEIEATRARNRAKAKRHREHLRAITPCVIRSGARQRVTGLLTPALTGGVTTPRPFPTLPFPKGRGKG